MENAVNALKMAAAILIFIIAIGVSFSLFGTAKQTADSIILMRDKQAYLESAEVDNGILYTSTEAIEKGSIEGFTEYGDRVVKKDTVISTIYRYNKEKYGVTIINRQSGKVIARFDSNTENVMRQWNNITSGKEEYQDKIKENISTKYLSSDNIILDLEELYEIKVPGNNNIKCGAPWYGNDEQIKTRISCELQGEEYKYNGQKYKKDSLNDILTNASEIIEVTNEIDESKYLEDETIEGNNKSTNLLQQYEMPTVEIVYILSE